MYCKSIAVPAAYFSVVFIDVLFVCILLLELL